MPHYIRETVELDIKRVERRIQDLEKEWDLADIKGDYKTQHSVSTMLEDLNTELLELKQTLSIL